mgnify:FL=1
MSSELLHLIITGLVTFLTTGGLGGILYYNLHKKLKEAEVKSAEISNVASSNAEWIKICEERAEEKSKLIEGVREANNLINELRHKINELNESKERSWEETSQCKIQCAKKDRIISELNWYRCEVNGCPYRKPPRQYGTYDFPKDGKLPEDLIQGSNENEN